MAEAGAPAVSDPKDYKRFERAFDIEDPAFAEHFEDVLEHLVAKCPVAHSSVGPGYRVFNRYEDVRRAGADWRTFSSADGWMLDPPEGNLPILPEDLDPPYHTAWRRALNPFFKPSAIRDIEPFARQYARELLDAFADRGHCEFVAEFAAQLPGLVLFKHLIPVPVEDLPKLFREIDTYSFGALDERAAAFGRVHEYLERFLRIRSEEAPKGDVIDAVLAGVERDGAACPWEDKVHTALDLVFGGLATTTHAISGAIYELAKAPEARRAIRDDSSCLDTAIDETVRLHAPVVAVGRTATADVEVCGVEIGAGERVALNYAAASRDPDVCSNPRKFDVRRKEVVHTAFGVGPHRCIGENLARLEIRISIDEFLKRVPEFGLAPGKPPEFESGQLRTMKHLHLNWRHR